MILFQLKIKITFFVIVPTRAGAMIPGIVANVLPIPKTMPENEPSILAN